MQRRRTVFIFERNCGTKKTKRENRPYEAYTKSSLLTTAFNKASQSSYMDDVMNISSLYTREYFYMNACGSYMW